MDSSPPSRPGPAYFLLILAMGGGAAAVVGAAAMRWPGLDVVNSFAPLSFAVALLCGAAAARRRAGRWLALAATAAGLLGAGPRLLPELVRAVPSADTEDLRLLTYNVWHKYPDPAGTVAAILAVDADVVLLQEADGSFSPWLERLYPAYPFRTRCDGSCETIILSRLPILASDWRVRGPDGDRIGPSLVWARLQGAELPAFTIVSVHLPRDSGQALADASNGLAAIPPLLGSERMILAGDMNLTPWSYALVRQDRALAPLVRLTRATATYPARLPLLPIDQVYAGPAWHAASIDRLPPGASDHRGVVASLARVG